MHAPKLQKSTKTYEILETCMLLTASSLPTVDANWISSLSSISSMIGSGLDSKPEISNLFCNSEIAAPSCRPSCRKRRWKLMIICHSLTEIFMNLFISVTISQLSSLTHTKFLNDNVAKLEEIREFVPDSKMILTFQIRRSTKM